MNTQTRRRVMGSKSIKYLTWIGVKGEDTKNYVEFDLGINLLAETTFDFDVFVCSNNWCNIIRYAKSRTGTWNNDKNILQIYYNPGVYFDLLYFNQATLISYGTLPTVGRHNFAFDKGFLIDGVRKDTRTPTTIAEGGNTWITGYRIYGLKMWNNGNLFCDFVPAISGNKYGLYDKVRGVFIEPTTGDITGE